MSTVFYPFYSTAIFKDFKAFLFFMSLQRQDVYVYRASFQLGTLYLHDSVVALQYSCRQSPQRKNMWSKEDVCESRR